MVYDTIVVGAGMAGLTAAAYVARAGHSVLLCEKAETVGGLVRTFERQGILYDGGIRAIENAGIVRPMLAQLGIEIEWLKSPVFIGIEDLRTEATRESGLEAYQRLLEELYPESHDEIAELVRQITRVMEYMDVLYGIDNPALIDLAQNPRFLLGTLLPWTIRYALAMPKIASLQGPVSAHLRQFMQNESLLDIIAQHFFRDTPASFALSYFTLYFDYMYPRGGTGTLPHKMAAYITQQGGAIKTNCEIAVIDPTRHTVMDDAGNVSSYRQLIWAADTKALYSRLRLDHTTDPQVRRAIALRENEIADKRGGDSVLTVFLGLELSPSYIQERGGAHFFYTPSRLGQSQAGPIPATGEREEVQTWLERFLQLTTYEISCPALRDPQMAPTGQTGLVVSILFDYDLVERIREEGWYEAFKRFVERAVVDILEKNVFPGLRASVVDCFSSTPLTMARLTNNTDGAITGWAFTNDVVPAEHRTMRITHAVRTPIPGVSQAGQWTFSPSGLPISVLTGKLAADRAIKLLGE